MQSSRKTSGTWIGCACIQALLFCTVVATTTKAADNVRGGWLSPAENNWPLIAIHAAMTPDGRVMTYGTKGDGQQTGYFIYDVWDPNAGLPDGHVTLNNLTRTDLFCSVQIIVPKDGSIFIAGGDIWDGDSTTGKGNSRTNLYRYTDDTLTRAADMFRPRWYASTTLLVNGEIYIQGGRGGADRPEVRTTNGTFRLLSNVDTSGLYFWYPRNFLAPDGRVFGYDTNGIMYYVDPAGTGRYTAAGTLPNQFVGATSSAAMFRSGRILQFGGHSNGAVVIDIRGGSPVVTPTQSMSTRRQWVSGTVLADGRVLATGGSAVANELTGVNNAAEIWDPATGRWTLGASAARARLYHSGALLLSDATVLVYGGGAPGPLTNLHAEIYYPPYLYNSAGSFRSRPVISSAPSTVEVGRDFSIVTDTTAVTRVTLIKMGSATHSANVEQRFFDLAFSQSSTTSFVEAPESATDAPPGYYLLFVFDDRGTPSVASILRVDAPAPSGADVTSTIGGTGGSPFNVGCNASEALVGVYGLANSTYIKQIGIRCVLVSSAGLWIGDPVNRGATGGTSGSSYTRTCPRDFAIAGFKGQSSDGVTRLRFECRALNVSGELKGAGQFVDWIGTSGGTTQGPYRCSTNHPGFALSGRSGARIDAVNVQCRKIP